MVSSNRTYSLDKEILEWLEKVSDQNLLQQYLNKLGEMPACKRRGLESKGYIAGSNYVHSSTNLYLTKKGKAFLKEIIEPIQ
jgi:hypothetical protein